VTPPVANFHGLGEPPAGVDAGEQPYWLSHDQFLRALDLLSASPQPFLVTFDDGNLSDLGLGMPACADRGIAAICFACSGRIGREEYLSAAQLREIAALPGCSVGSHGRDHLPWRDLDNAALAAEAVESRKVLEDVLARPVTALGLPFGAYDRRVLRAARKAGFRRIYSSDGGPRLFGGGVIPRLSLRADRPIEEQVRALVAAASPLRAAAQEAKLLIKALR